MSQGRLTVTARVFGLVFALALGGAGQAGAESGTFDVSLSGFRAGVLAYAGEEKNGRYAASGSVRAAGIAGRLVEAQVDVSAKGKVRGNGYAPQRYDEKGERKGKALVTRYEYRNGAPKITRTPPRKKPPKYGVPAAQQKGTLDPMTTAFAMLRDRPRDLACRLELDLFDGLRRANIRYVKAEPRPDGGITCQGQFRRVAGFSPDELAEKEHWPFTVIYAPKGDQMRVMQVKVPTTLGTLRMKRR